MDDDLIPKADTLTIEETAELRALLESRVKAKSVHVSMELTEKIQNWLDSYAEEILSTAEGLSQACSLASKLAASFASLERERDELKMLSLRLDDLLNGHNIELPEQLEQKMSALREWKPSNRETAL